MKRLTLIAMMILFTACASKKTTELSAAETAKAAAATAATEGAANKITCTHGKEQRLLEVKKSKADGCDLLYTKFGSEKSVASSGAGGNKYCMEVRDKITTNLTKSGFKCE